MTIPIIGYYSFNERRKIMTYKEALETRLTEGYEALAELELGTDEYKKAAESLKALQEALNGINKSENAIYAVDARTAQNKAIVDNDLKIRMAELASRMAFKGFWNHRYMLFEKDGVIKTLGARNSMNDTNRW